MGNRLVDLRTPAALNFQTCTPRLQWNRPLMALGSVDNWCSPSESSSFTHIIYILYLSQTSMYNKGTGRFPPAKTCSCIDINEKDIYAKLWNLSFTCGTLVFHFGWRPWFTPVNLWTPMVSSSQWGHPCQRAQLISAPQPVDRKKLLRTQAPIAWLIGWLAALEGLSFFAIVYLCWYGGVGWG